MPVKVLDAGGKYMLSGAVREEVEAELQKYLARGAKATAVVQQVGSLWVTACSIPRDATADSTQTLRLADLQTAPEEEPEFPEDDTDFGCTVTELGFKRIITGPTKFAVEQKIKHMKQFGADVIGQPEERDGAWEALVDTGGADKAYRF